MSAQDGKWKSMETAPRDGTVFIGRRTTVDKYSGKLLYTNRRTWWGKTSHIPLHGWCWMRFRDHENVDLWEPTHWTPITARRAPAQETT